MKRAIPLALVLALALLVAGCGPTREDRFAQYEAAMGMAVSTLDDLYLHGHLTHREFLAFDPLVLQLRLIRSEMRQHLATGDDEAWWEAAGRFGDVLGGMNAQLRGYEKQDKEPPDG